MSEGKPTLEFERGIEVDEKDTKILGVIANNARARISEIAKKTGLTRDVIKYRIKKMEDAGIIVGYMTIMSPPNFGFTILGNVFVRFWNLDAEKERQFMDYLVKHPYVGYVCVCAGAYDLVLEITARNLGHFHKIVREINIRFADIIKTSETAFLLDELKWTHFPGDIIGDVSGRLTPAGKDAGLRKMN